MRGRWGGNVKRWQNGKNASGGEYLGHIEGARGGARGGGFSVENQRLGRS